MITETKLPSLLHRGKVRDTYQLDQKRLLMVSTDRISAFDVVLPMGIPEKGRVLNQISAFWFNKTRHLVPNHYIMAADDPRAAADIEARFGPEGLPAEIAQQAMIVNQAERIDIECVVRGYIAGSAWSEYRSHGTVSGKPVPAGLLECEAFPEVLFTPTTKAEEGHDENMSDQEVLDMVGSDLAKRLADVSIAVFQFGKDYALERGIILADTKMEFGLLDGELILIDELLTPDSSRFWDAESYSPGKSQPSFDKQPVRDWLANQDWNKEPPAPPLPEDVVAQTSERYLDAYYLLTGERLA